MPPKISPHDLRNGFIRTQGSAGSPPTVAPGTTVGHIIEMRDLGPRPAGGVATHSGPFRVTDPNVTGAIEKPVPAVIIHAKQAHSMFSVPHRGMPLAIGDVIKTSPTTVLAIHFVLGGEVGVDRGSTVQVVSERSVADVSSGIMRMLGRGHIWANVSHEKSQKLLIQTNGGVLGIKG